MLPAGHHAISKRMRAKAKEKKKNKSKGRAKAKPKKGKGKAKTLEEWQRRRNCQYSRHYHRVRKAALQEGEEDEVAKALTLGICLHSTPSDFVPSPREGTPDNDLASTKTPKSWICLTGTLAVLHMPCFEVSNHQLRHAWVELWIHGLRMDNLYSVVEEVLASSMPKKHPKHST